MTYGLARKALPGAINGMTGQIDFNAIDLTIRASGVEEEDYERLFTGVFYYLLSYRTSQFNKQPGQKGITRTVNPQAKVLAKR